MNVLSKPTEETYNPENIKSKNTIIKEVINKIKKCIIFNPLDY